MVHTQISTLIATCTCIMCKIQRVLEGISITVFSLVNFGLQPVEQVKGESGDNLGYIISGDWGFSYRHVHQRHSHFLFTRGGSSVGSVFVW